MTTVRQKLKSKHRSAVANGSRVLAKGVDMRTAYARRVVSAYHDIVSELGGEAELSSQKRELVLGAATLIGQMQLMADKFADQDGVASQKELDLYQRCLGNLGRAFERTGLERVVIDVTPIDAGALLRGEDD